MKLLFNSQGIGKTLIDEVKSHSNECQMIGANGNFAGAGKNVSDGEQLIKYSLFYWHSLPTSFRPTEESNLIHGFGRNGIKHKTTEAAWLPFAVCSFAVSTEATNEE